MTISVRRGGRLKWKGHPKDVWDFVPMAIGTPDHPLEDEYSEDERQRRLKELQLKKDTK
jgi:hypothetical protein